jgi:NAD-dependent deacetylase
VKPESRVPGRFIERLAEARSLVVLTGAGVSQESGVPTFRGTGGLWENHKQEELATLNAFESDPDLVWRWYDYRRQIIAEAQPNRAHHAIARLEQGFRSFTLVTQNVDGLHGRAGSRRPLELHGNIWRARCMAEHIVVDLPETPLRVIPPTCRKCGALLRPDVVWFGEPLAPEAFDESYRASSSCDAMIVVGTSAMVRPAASLPLVAKHNGAYVVEVNPGYTPISTLIDATLIGTAGTLLPDLCNGVLELTGNRAQSAQRASR